MTLYVNTPAIERFSKLVEQDGLMTHRMAEFIEAITMQVNHSMIISGDGSPEGVIKAEPLKIYIDTTADAIYYKKTGSGGTGWVLT